MVLMLLLGLGLGGAWACSGCVRGRRTSGRGRRRRRRRRRPGRADAGARPAQRPDARPRPPARLLAGAAQPAGARHAAGDRHAAARDPDAVDGAAQAAGARPVGRDAPAARRRAGRPGRPLRLHRAGPHRRPATTPCSGPTSSSSWSAGGGWWSTPRSRSTRSSTPPAPTTTTSARPTWPATPASCASTSTCWRPSATGARSRGPRSSSCCSCRPSRSSSAALTADRDLLDDAAAKQVVLATPTTLIALLRTVAHGWRHEALAGQAQEIHQLGRELHERLATLTAHVDNSAGRSTPRSATTTRGRLARVAGAGLRATVRRPLGHRRRASRAPGRSVRAGPARRPG